MTLEIHASTVEWILGQMESLTKQVMTSIYVGESKVIIEKIGRFNALKELLDNSDYESYGLKFKVIFPTKEEYGAKNE